MNDIMEIEISHGLKNVNCLLLMESRDGTREQVSGQVLENLTESYKLKQKRWVALLS
jgi:hypothetical protein